jgi:undecaprenyl diphosphate synthase
MIFQVISQVLQKFKHLFGCLKDKIFGLSDEQLREIVRTKKLNHVALMADGHRQWAKKHGKPSSEGHRIGFMTIMPDRCKDLWGWGVSTVTLLFCSVNNVLKRDKAEVDNFLKLIDLFLKEMLPFIKQNEIRVVHLGNKSILPEYLVKAIEQAEQETKTYSKKVLNMAVGYDAPDELARSMKRYLNTDNSLDSLTGKALLPFLDTLDQSFPCPDLIIRTSGCIRLSGFMPMQGHYSELYFTKKFFPEFDRRELIKAIVDFDSRTRLFGK